MTTRIAHLQLQDPFGNKSTLICNLRNGSIEYFLYGSWNSSGIPHSLSNLQCTLPVDKTSKEETRDQFVQRLIDTINAKSVKRVVNVINSNITF